MDTSKMANEIGVHGIIYGNKRNLLVVLFGVESGSPYLEWFTNFSSHKYDEIRVVRSEDLSVQDHIMMLSSHHVLYIGPRSVLKNVFVDLLKQYVASMPNA